MLRDRETGRLIRASSAGVGVAQEAFVPEPEVAVEGHHAGRPLTILLHRGLVFGFAALGFDVVTLAWTGTMTKAIQRAATFNYWNVPAILFFVAGTPSLLAFLGIISGVALRRRGDGAGIWVILLCLFSLLLSMVFAVPYARLGVNAYQYVQQVRGGR